ncbi:hypothetical protein [Ligilactobacillus pobuzihii]|uniref:Uncharacterized protein n=1 Tax=Ligilactobacillus pobuzihii TaxID=449659 RepID=A0A0R2L8C9_9LACO|nr:hypothetical protein [Ligilactobacillus pobuzihii]KRK10659.1 hypothetical protein FD11_GL001669 [Ligilactobacillus pobuzihii E100301 = KCTC 13174]KRN98079.1 hypothetical protein IV66_GL000369 [Ligilactobacillus pobuzihii]GEN47488.1 hypothetical protein LPO01_02800 [Ligilactobacillus pobuzihii]HIZ96782.1 hypothetical protein [Candidatus Ligilactobacillus excrementavium]
MREYWELLKNCTDLGDEINSEYFSDARDLAQTLNISVNTFAKRFGDLPRFKNSDVGHPENWGDAVVCKSHGIIFFRLNETLKEALNKYLNAVVF